MCVRHCGPAWTLMLPLLVLPGGLCSQWAVFYPEKNVCAVRNTTAVFRCSYRYPASYKVETVKWAHGRSSFYDGPFFYDSANNSSSSRFEYIGNKTGNCSLKIHQVEQEDAGEYAFRFTTNDPVGKVSGAEGLTLNITDLKVLLTTQRGDGTVKEGDSLSLTCKNACDDNRASSSFTWFKNGQRVKEGPVHDLINVSSTDSGNYTCSLSAHTGTTSRVLNINVEHGPKNTLVEVDVGSNITLTCSSQANPPVESYVWFDVKENHVEEVGQGSVLVTDVGGQFLCSASNKHGSQNSSVVKTKGQLEITQVIIINIVVILLIIIVVSAVIRFKMRGHRRGRESQENVQNTVYANWHDVGNNDRPREENECEGGPVELVYTTVDFDSGKKSKKTQRPRDGDDGDVVYSTVCK